MEDISPEAEPCLHEVNSPESQLSCEEEEKSAAGSNSDGDESEKDAKVHTRTLLSRIDDFRQSYNRTHGQVCEFFERARVVQRLGLLDPTQAAQLALSGDEAEEEDCNSLADCNCADGQKTTGMKRKLRKWRKVMRSALLEICPNMGVENQPDINPGLMKHVLDEVRQLKNQLACQHSSILQLARKSEMYRVDSERKEQFISDLLQNCKGIRLDSVRQDRPKDVMGQGPASFEESTPNETNLPIPESVDDIHFGQSKDLINSLPPDVCQFLGPDVVVNPIDFSVFQQQQPQQQTRQNGGPSRDAAGSTSTTSFLPPISGLQQQGLSGRAVQAHPASCPGECSVSTTSVRGTDSAGMTSRAESATSPNRRHILMNLGSGLTAAVVGGLVLNSVHRKRQ